MYFTNVSDTELSQFHETVTNNFEMLLTSVLTSNLFKVETIMSNEIYKIFPLFYCEEIISSNPDDKILDNKCAICAKKDNTVLEFKTKHINTDVLLNWASDGTQYGFTIFVYNQYTGDPISDVVVEGIVNKPTESFKGTTDKEGIFTCSFNLSHEYLLDLTKLYLTYDGVTYHARG